MKSNIHTGEAAEAGKRSSRNNNVIYRCFNTLLCGYHKDGFVKYIHGGRLMRKILTMVFILLVASHTWAQEDYSLRENIPYYSDSISLHDNYIVRQCLLDIYYPLNIENFSTVVWFHGGGLTSGDKDIPDGLKEKGICVVSVNYRLYPEVKCPAYLQDAAASVAWVIRNIKDYGGDPDMVFVAGHSAGGYLATMTGLDKQWLAQYSIDANTLAGIISLSGQAITHFTIRRENGIAETQPVIDEYAPLSHIRADAPPLLLITGDREMELLGRYEENAYLARMMKIAGHKETRLFELEGYGHMMITPAVPLLIKEVRSVQEQRKAH